MPEFIEVDEPICSKCRSKNVQKSSAVVDGGTTHEVSDQSNIGVSTGGFGVENARGKAIAITNAAKKNTAPNNDDIKGAAIVGAIIGFSVVAKMGLDGIYSIFTICFISVLISGGYYYFIRESKQNERRRYDRQWYCHTCGSIFHR